MFTQLLSRLLLLWNHTLLMLLCGCQDVSALYLPSEHFQLLSILHRAQSDRFIGDSLNVRPLYHTCLRTCFRKINKEVVADFTKEKCLPSAPYWALCFLTFLQILGMLCTETLVLVHAEIWLKKKPVWTQRRSLSGLFSSTKLKWIGTCQVLQQTKKAP